MTATHHERAAGREAEAGGEAELGQSKSVMNGNETRTAAHEEIEQREHRRRRPENIEVTLTYRQVSPAEESAAWKELVRILVEATRDLERA